MIRLAAAAIFVLAFSASGALAAEPESTVIAAKARIEAKTPAAPAFPVKQRLTTAERWRGKPYLRSSETQNLRKEALDKSLPLAPIAPAFSGGTPAMRSLEGEFVRKHALDMALPIGNPSFVGGF